MRRRFGALAEPLYVRRSLISPGSCSLSEFEIVRPSQDHPEATIRTGKLAVNLEARVVSVDDQPMHVSATEYAILELLSLRKGTILTKEMFLDRLYRGINEPQLKIIDVFLCKLRKKLAQATGGNHYIETVWGRGYMLRDPATTAATRTRPP